MILFIGQMLGCLIVAAGIGVVVGWLLRQLSAGQLTQQSMDVTATLRLKEQLLEKLQHQLHVQTTEMQMLENRIIESEEMNQVTSQELSSRHSHIEALQQEVAVRTQRLSALEAENALVSRHLSAPDALVAAQSEETRQLHLTRQTAQQTLELNEQERQTLHGRITELEATLTETNQLRARVEELEAAQGRVHWLEVQLSDQEAEHRAIVHQFTSQLAVRDQRITELEPLAQRLQEHIAALKQRETQHNAQIAALKQQLAARDQLQIQVLSDKQLLNERDKQIDDLQHRIQGLEARQQGLEQQLQTAVHKQEEIDRLRKRIVERQAASRMKTDEGALPPLPKPRQTGAQLSLLAEQMKAMKDGPKDDLSQIHGIGPIFARTLNKMGLYTFVQIASWKPEDIDKVAKKLYTAPDRIKRDNWINEAKRLHNQKYGQQL